MDINDIVNHVEGSMGSLLVKLGSLLAQETHKLRGVRDDIQELKDELESMNAFLQDLAKTEDHDNQVKTWMKQVREMAYDIEDCIDEFVHRVGAELIQDRFLRPLQRSIRLARTLKARHQVASKIRSLKTRIHSVGERRSRYANQATTPKLGGPITLFRDPRFPTNFFLEQREVVGIEDRTDKLVNLLVDSNVPDRRVLSIVGYGGLGKTTLAMTAYESQRVKSGHFQCRAQISVSQNLNFNVLVREILKQVLPSPENQKTREVEITRKNPLEFIENLNETELVRKLEEYLKEKRYLIIIDDIWTESDWNRIKYVFPHNNKGSRIVVTTRIKSVAKSCSFPHDNYVYQIEHLNSEQSKNLFFQKVFGPSNSCPPELENISKIILKKCGGMPLAIVSIAGLLSVKPKTEQEWVKVYESLGSELETNPSLEGMGKILSLSYNDLPYHLKTCFLYMSIFPEDYSIERKQLVRKWVAEGFVSGKRGINEVQVAETYFDEFVNRNLIQVVDFSLDGRVKTCRVHDMILELMVSKSVEENFVSLIGHQYSILPRNKIRRLSVHSAEQNLTNFGLYHVRSLSIFTDLLGISIPLPAFGVMRVLDLEGCGLKNGDLRNVSNLFLLKYLGLRNNWNLSKLPAQIGKLKYLEMLDIKGTGISKLPKRGSNFQNLKHLYASYLKISSSKLKSMTSLQTLTIALFNKRNLKSLENLKDLRKLGFEIPSNIKKELPTIELNENLSSLELCCDGGSIPDCVYSLQYLVKLTITSLTLTDSDVQKLGTLPKLLSLKINWFIDSSDQEKKIIFRKNLFQNLESLKFADFEVFQVVFEKEAACNLKRLSCSYYFECDETLKECAIGIEHLLKLEEIEISYRGTRPSCIDTMKEHPNHPNIIEENCNPHQ